MKYVDRMKGALVVNYTADIGDANYVRAPFASPHASRDDAHAIIVRTYV